MSLAAAALEWNAAPHPPGSARSVPVLIIDDDAGKRLALKAVLAPLGYDIVEADSGAAGLRCLMRAEYAVILLDVRMPIMDGFETAALIRMRKQSEVTPIIFVTAHNSDEVLTDRYAQGAVDFITTPVNPDELRAKVSVFAKLFLQAQANAAKARELQTSADQLRLLTETAPIGIFQTDSHNRYVYTNARWSEITGMAAGDALGQEWHLIISEEQRASLAGNEETSPDSEFSTRLVLQVPGEEPRILMLTSKSLLDDEGGITGWVGTLADVTAEAGAEAAMAEARDQATAASRLKSDFLANMSHEIRTPMNGVIGLTELLLDTELDVQQRKFAETLSKSGEALMTVINGILDFAKIEKGKLEIEDIEFGIQTIVDDVIDLLAPSAQTKGLKLMAILEDSVPVVVSGDPSRLRQVLTNLAGNAIKFTETGEVVLRVTAAPAEGSETVVHFELTDTGLGIAPDKLAMIFEPFTQADTSTTREYGGTGLGLAISSQLIALMGGEVGITSELGAGSTFSFTIRVQTVRDESDTRRQPLDVRMVGVRALIVDDNLTQRSILSDYLGRWGMDVQTAVSSTGALDVLRAAAAQDKPITVAVVDTSMQRLQGVSLEAAIFDDASLDTRLVLMTEERDLDDLAELGDAVCLSKPIHRQDLHACLLEVLELPQRDDSATGLAETVSEGGTEAGLLLLAEDNVINQVVAVAILTKAGYQVETVRNGAQAVLAAAGQHYDAILMDCQMPQMNGYQATAAIRLQEGVGRRTPIIALTAGARGEDRDHCLEVGMDDYLAKPLHKEPLLMMLRDWIDAETAPDDLGALLPHVT
jgi:two-component system sensor histidine kinase/response regulator